MPALGLPSVFQDVSQELPHVWQMIDGGTRIIKRALKTGGLYQQPEARAHVEQIVKDLDQMIKRYGMAGSQMGPTSQPPQKTAGTTEPAAQPDAGEGAIAD